jgi:hypothetical protein
MEASGLGSSRSRGKAPLEDRASHRPLSQVDAVSGFMADAHRLQPSGTPGSMADSRRAQQPLLHSSDEQLWQLFTRRRT